MKKQNNSLGFAIGAVIGTAFAVYVASQQGIYAEAQMDAVKSVDECKVIITQEEIQKPVAEKPVEEPVEATLEEPETEPALVSLGEFKLTAYCACEKCCGEWALDRPVDKAGNPIIVGACGEVLVEGVSIAVDKSVIPYGAEVLVNGYTYKAQDCGGAIKGNRIDVYFESHEDALEFGVQYAEVFLKKGAGENGT